MSFRSLLALTKVKSDDMLQNYHPTHCVRLIINAEDIDSEAESTTATYTAITNGYYGDDPTQNPLTYVPITGNVPASACVTTKNDSANDIQKTVSYTYTITESSESTTAEGTYIHRGKQYHLGIDLYCNGLVYICNSDSAIENMWIDGSKVTKSTTHTFSSEGIHNIKIGFYKNQDDTVSIPDNFCQDDLYQQKFTKFTGIEITNLVNTIGVNAFQNCTQISAISIGDHVSEIKSNAFDHTNISSIRIPTSVISIESNAFANLSNLASVYYLGTIDQWINIDFENEYSNPLTSGHKLYISNNLLRNVNLTTVNSIMNLKPYLFTGASYITSLVMNNYIISIGQCCFKNCSSLSNIVFSNSIKTIGIEAFYGCESLISVKLPDSISDVTVLGNTTYGIQSKAFCNCLNLREIILNNKEFTIGSLSFSNCPYLHTITSYILQAPSIQSDSFGVSGSYSGRSASTRKLRILAGSTGYSTGYWSSHVTEQSQCDFTIVNIPYVQCSYPYTSSQKDIRILGENIIFDNIETIWIDSTINNVRTTRKISPSTIITFPSLSQGDTYNINVVFNNTSTILNNTFSNIGEVLVNGVYDSYVMPSIIISDGITNINNSSFANSYIDSITFNTDLVNIGISAFSRCVNLSQALLLPNTVETIGEDAFFNSGVTSISIPASVTTIDSNAFSSCTNLASISVDANNLNYSSQNGVLFNKALTLLNQYPAGKTDTSYIIPSSVTTLRQSSFRSCAYLQTIDFRSATGISSIPSYTFQGCINLSTIIFQNSGSNSNIGSIGDYSFSNCPKLQGITLPYVVRDSGNSNHLSIGAYAFNGSMNDDSLSNITLVIDSRVNSIGIGAFKGCNKIKNIEWCPSSCSLGYSVEGSYSSVSDTPFSSLSLISFTFTPDSGSSITSIPGGLFANQPFVATSSNHNSIILPSTITSIGAFAFYGCPYLDILDSNNEIITTLPNSVTSIGISAFYGCSNLILNSLSTSLQSIGHYAFHGCTGIQTLDTLSNNLSSIGEYAFSNMINLSNIKFNNIEYVSSGVTKYVPVADIYMFNGYDTVHNYWSNNHSVSLTIDVNDSHITDYQSAANWIVYSSLII